MMKAHMKVLSVALAFFMLITLVPAPAAAAINSASPEIDRISPLNRSKGEQSSPNRIKTAGEFDRGEKPTSPEKKPLRGGEGAFFTSSASLTSSSGDAAYWTDAVEALGGDYDGPEYDEASDTCIVRSAEDLAWLAYQFSSDENFTVINEKSPRTSLRLT